MDQPSRVWNMGSPRFPQPGEDAEPDQDQGAPDIGVASSDPLFPHVVRALSILQIGGFDVHDPNMIERAVEAGRVLQDQAKKRAKAQAPTIPAGYFPQPPPGFQRMSNAQKRRPPEPPRVYYMRIGNRCKIGWSANLLTRLHDINPEELMAVEPGGADVERRRHAEFGSLRTHGEWFRLEDPLVGHVNRLATASRAEVFTIDHRSARFLQHQSRIRRKPA